MSVLLTAVGQIVERDDTANERANKADELTMIVNTDAVPDPGTMAAAKASVKTENALVRQLTDRNALRSGYNVCNAGSAMLACSCKSSRNAGHSCAPSK